MKRRSPAGNRASTDQVDPERTTVTRLRISDHHYIEADYPEPAVMAAGIRASLAIQSGRRPRWCDLRLIERWLDEQFIEHGGIQGGDAA